eukprot:3853832-Amphidinium_carterae.3
MGFTLDLITYQKVVILLQQVFLVKQKQDELRVLENENLLKIKKPLELMVLILMLDEDQAKVGVSLHAARSSEDELCLLHNYTNN